MVRPSGASAGCPSQVSRAAEVPPVRLPERGHLPGERRVPGGVVGKDLVEHDGQGAPGERSPARTRSIQTDRQTIAGTPGERRWPTVWAYFANKRSVGTIGPVSGRDGK